MPWTPQLEEGNAEQRNNGKTERQKPRLKEERGLTDIESAPLAATMELSRNHGPQQGGALMKRTTKYVGFDVHQATIVLTVRDDAGRVIARSVIATEAATVLECVRGMRGSIHVALEEGTQAQWLYELLRPVVDEVVVCDRRGQSVRDNKGDHQDAD